MPNLVEPINNIHAGLNKRPPTWQGNYRFCNSTTLYISPDSSNINDWISSIRAFIFHVSHRMMSILHQELWLFGGNLLRSYTRPAKLVGSILDSPCSASLPFLQWIHRWPVNSPHKRTVTRKMFPFDSIMCSSLYSELLIVTTFSLFFVLF